MTGECLPETGRRRGCCPVGSYGPLLETPQPGHLCPPEARLLPRARGRRRPRAEGGMSRRLPRALGPEGRGSAASYASELRRLGRRARVRRGQRRPLSGSRRRG